MTRNNQSGKPGKVQSDLTFITPDGDVEEIFIPPPGKSWLIGYVEPDEILEDTEVVEKVGSRTFLTVVIYDIVDNKKRTALSKMLLGYGERVQKSAFECHLTNKKYEEMVSNALRFIDIKEDLLRIYKLTGTTQVQLWGKVPQTIDEDVIII